MAQRHMLCSFLLLVLLGKKSPECLERASEVAGTGEGPPSPKTSHRDPPVHAGAGDGSDQGLGSEDQDD